MNRILPCAFVRRTATKFKKNAFVIMEWLAERMHLPQDLAGAAEEGSSEARCAERHREVQQTIEKCHPSGAAACMVHV